MQGYFTSFPAYVACAELDISKFIWKQKANLAYNYGAATTDIHE